MNTADPTVIQKFKDLPQKLKDALFSEDTTDTIFDIGKANGLTVFQMEELADEVSLVILGINAPENFVKNISKTQGIDQTKASALTDTVSEKIFKPILGDIKALARPTIVPAVTAIANEVQKPTAPTANQPAPITTKPLSEVPVPQEKKKEFVSPAPKPSSAPPQAKSELSKTQTAETSAPAQIFVKPLPDPYREPLVSEEQAQPQKQDSKNTPVEKTIAPPATKARIINWEDILKSKSREPGTHPDAKIALEKALSDNAPQSIVPPTNAPIVSTTKETVKAPEGKITTSNTPKYVSGSDPYREPLE